MKTWDEIRSEFVNAIDQLLKHIPSEDADLLKQFQETHFIIYEITLMLNQFYIVPMSGNYVKDADPPHYLIEGIEGISQKVETLILNQIEGRKRK